MHDAAGAQSERGRQQTMKNKNRMFRIKTSKNMITIAAGIV